MTLRSGVIRGRYWNTSGSKPAGTGRLPARSRAAAPPRDARCPPTPPWPPSVGLGVITTNFRRGLAALFAPTENTDRMRSLIHAAENAPADTPRSGDRALITGDTRALLAAARREVRQWTDEETARLGVALTSYTVRDAAWLAIDTGQLDGRDLFVHWPADSPIATARRRCSCSAGSPGATATAPWPRSPSKTPCGPIRPTRPPNSSKSPSPAPSTPVGCPSFSCPAADQGGDHPPRLSLSGPRPPHLPLRSLRLEGAPRHDHRD